uniref:Uncharacterized protein n=1 Tax=Capra hircus TaxID=9925 RepID=A0A8C2NZV5_CAPHI
MYLQVCTRTALEQTDRQGAGQGRCQWWGGGTRGNSTPQRDGHLLLRGEGGGLALLLLEGVEEAADLVPQILLQETQVIFHVPRQGAQLLPERVQLLHHGFVEGLAIGPHGAAEVLHLLVQAAAQLGQGLLQALGVARLASTHAVDHGHQPLPQFLGFGRDLGLQLLGMLLHLKGQALQLVVELPLDVLSIRGQAAAQFLHVLLDLGLELVRVGRQALAEVLQRRLGLLAQRLQLLGGLGVVLRQAAAALLERLQARGQPLAQVVAVGRQLLPQRLHVGARAVAELLGQRAQLVLQLLHLLARALAKLLAQRRHLLAVDLHLLVPLLELVQVGLHLLPHLLQVLVHLLPQRRCLLLQVVPELLGHRAQLFTHFGQRAGQGVPVVQEFQAERGEREEDSGYTSWAPWLPPELQPSARACPV